MRSISTRKSADSATSKRSVLRRWLDQLAGRDPRSVKRGRLLLESLESRQLLAGDVELLFTDSVETVDDSQTAQTTSAFRSSIEAEGELAPDLVAFAEALSDKGVTFFGAAWCSACTVQKELFQDGGDNLPYVEVTGPDRSLNQIGVDEGIEEFPTWEFPDGSRETGVLSLQTLSDRSDVPIPQSETPRFESLGTQTVEIGAPRHVPIDVYDPDGGVQTVTVSIDDPDLVTAEVLSGNRSLRIDMETYGDMVFETFEQRAETASRRVIELAEADFYNDIIFHRVINQFMIQAGATDGVNAKSTGLDPFDDDFHPDLQHNRTGVLSIAKAGDDTNDAGFFITEVPTRHLDFNHSIIGQLVEGDDVREAISNHRTNGTVPTVPVRIETIDVFTDIENSVVMLKATGNGTGATNATFTVTDPDGNSYSETVRVEIAGDSSNAQPYLNEVIVPAAFPQNLPAEIQLSSTDLEGDAVSYFSSLLSGDATAVVNPTTGLLTVTPTTGFSGEVLVRAGVEPGPGLVGNGPDESDIEDTQLLRLNFEAEQPDAPTSLDLLTGSDSGSSDIDNITNLGSLTFSVGGVSDGATVEIVLVTTGAVIGFGNASGDTATITTNNIAALGDGSYRIAARQRIGGLTSDLSTSITVVYDTQSPASVVNSALTRANVGVEYRSDLISTEEGSGLRYAILSGPTGAVIDSTTGLIVWTPTRSQAGQETFTIELTDVAGNARSESFNVDVAGTPLIAAKLELTDLDGNEISTVQVGQEFLLNFIGVDRRSGFTRDGVFAAFADILFDSSLVRPVPGSAIDHADDFPSINSGTFSDGLIDELGAASAETVATGETESLIATVRMEAIAAGSLNIRTDPADLDISEMLLYGVDEEISDEFVEYRSVGLAIGQNFVVGDDQFDVQEDSEATTLDVLGNDDVVQGSATLSVVSVTPPSSGAAVELLNGEVVFTPDGDFNGDVVFTYRVSDTTGGQEDGTVTVTVTAVNDPPTGESDSFDVDENSTANSLDVLQNDSDAPDSGETLRIIGVDSQTVGVTVAIGPDAETVLYTPPADFTGNDTFTYTVSDGELRDQDIQVFVTVVPVDPPPTAVDDAFDVGEDDDEDEFDVLSNDQRDQSDQSFVLDSATASQGGSVRISADGTQFFYAPATDFFGTEEVLYTIRDTGGGISTATATFTVAASNDPPPISDPTVTVNRGSGESVILKISDLPTNVDGDFETLTFSLPGTPTAGGSVGLNDDGDIVYTPPTVDFVGTDRVSFVVNDGSGLTSAGTITIDVTDLIPRDVFLASLLDDGLPRIEGVKLVGKDALGASVEMSLLYDNGSDPRFDDILPGEYSIQIPAIPFLSKSGEPQTIPLISTADDGDTTITPDLGRLLPQYISIRDWLLSAPRRTVLAAVAPGSISVLADVSPSTDTVSDPVVTLDDSGDSITVRGTDPTSGDEIEVTLPVIRDRRVQMRGESGDLQLLKINVEREDVSFSSVSTNGGINGETTGAEGELIDSATSSFRVSGAAEGELIAAVSQVNTIQPSIGADRSGDSSQEPEILHENDSRETSVDAAMQDVAEALTRISPTGESLAETANDPSGLDGLAVDAVLGEQL